MSFPYSARYQPSMPVADIALGAPEADFTLGPLSAILDTGADITLVPRGYLIQLDAPVVASGYLRRPWEKDKASRCTRSMCGFRTTSCITSKLPATSVRAK